MHREYFGDGSVRQIAPISPALHLGADRVLVVGTGRQSADQSRARSNIYPSLAQIAGHALNSHLPRRPVGGPGAPGAHQPHA